MSAIHPSSYEFDDQGRHGALGAAARAVGVGAAALLLAGHAKMLAQKLHDTTEPTVEVGEESGVDRLLFPIFGCNANHKESAQNFERNLGHLGTVVHTVMPNVGVPVESLKAKLIEVRRNRSESSTVGYAHSAAGILWGVMASDPKFRRDFGSPDLLIVEASFADRSAISNEGKLLLGGAAIARLSYLVAHSPGVSAPPYMTAALRHFMYTHELAQGSMEGFAKRVVSIRAPHDRFVDNVVADASLAYVFGDQPIEHVVDMSRPAICHDSAAAYPQAAGVAIAEQREYVKHAA